MFAYCNNSPVNGIDSTGALAGATVIGIGIIVSAVIGGIVAAVSTAASGGTGKEIVLNGIIGAVVSGGIAAVTAFVPSVAVSATTATVGKTIISATIGAVGEMASQAVEYCIHKDEPQYTYDPLNSTGKVLYAAVMGGLCGYVSTGINNAFKSNDLAGTFSSGVAAASLGATDFGMRQLIGATSCANNSNMNVSTQPTYTNTNRGGIIPHNYVMAPY